MESDQQQTSEPRSVQNNASRHLDLNAAVFHLAAIPLQADGAGVWDGEGGFEQLAVAGTSGYPALHDDLDLIPVLRLVLLQFLARAFGLRPSVERTGAGNAREPNWPRRVGPQRVQDFGLCAEVEVPAVRKAGPRASRGSSPALVLAPGERSGRRSSVGDLLAKPPSCHMGNASTVVPRDHELGRAPLTRGVGLVHSSRIRSNQRSAARKGSPRRSR